MLPGAVNFTEVGERRVLPEGFCVLDQHLAIADDGIERRAEFMAHVGENVLLA